MLDFIGIGAQKAGTTWLYNILRHHPEINFPAGKEIHFWDLKYDQGIDWYASIFSVSRDQTAGEFTPAYAILSVERIREIRRHFPDLRLIYIIRNPIKRAWSSALMALHRAEMEPYEASDQWFIDHFHSRGSLSRGDYETCLKNWHSVYSPDQLLLLRFEHLVREPRELLDNVCRHLGISLFPVAYLDDNVVNRAIDPVPNKATIPIRPSLLPTLRDIYYPRIRSLAGYLSEDFDDWYI